MKNIEHCCKMMNDFLKDIRVQIEYIPKYREYYIPLSYRKKITAIQCLLYCPWCGIKLPESLRDQYFDILEKEYGIENDTYAEEEGILPEEFKTDKWWKKRGL